MSRGANHQWGDQSADRAMPLGGDEDNPSLLF